MAKLIWHVGMHKTGSTAIQTSLARAESSEFIYPQMGTPPFKTHHGDSVIQLFSSKAIETIARYRAAGKPFQASVRDGPTLLQAGVDAGRRSVILSSEGAYASLDKSDLGAAARFIAPTFNEVTIVGYIRAPLPYLSSAFQQAIKTSGLANFRLKYKHYRNFRNFDQTFGREHVKLWLFDRKAFPDGDVVQHFCSQLGLTAPRSLQINRSLSRPAVAAIYRMNRLARARNDGAIRAIHKAAKSAVIESFPHADWPTFRLSPLVIEPVIAANIEDIRWMEERLGCSLRGHNKPQAGDVADEADLLRIDPGALEQLSALAETLSKESNSFLRSALEN